MPWVTQKPTGQQNGDIVTQFVNTTSTTSVIYEYPTQQSELFIKNNGTNDIFVSVGSISNRTLASNSILEVKEPFLNFSIRSNVNSQQFTATSIFKEAKDITGVNNQITEVNNKITNLNTQLADNTQENLKLGKQASIQWLNSFRKLENDMDTFIAPTTVDFPTITYSTTEPQSGSTLSGQVFEVSSLTRSGTVATGVTLYPHGLPVGSEIVVTIAGASNSLGDSNSYNGKKTVTIVDFKTFTYPIINTANPTTATGSITMTLQASYFSSSEPLFSYNTHRSSLTSEIGASNANWMNGYSEVVGTNPFSVEFGCSDNVFEIATRRMFGFRILVNGLPISSTPLTTTDVSYPLFRVKVQFKSAKNRNIRIEFQNKQSFVGVWSRDSKSIFKIETQYKPKCLMLSDSFGEGTGAANGKFGSLTAYIGYKMGWEMINGSLGSTGITTVGVQGVGNDYIGRLSRLYAKYKPDIIFVMASVNDGGNITEANAGILFDAISEMCPNAKQIAFGQVWVNPSPSANILTSSSNFKKAADARSIPYLDGGIGLNGQIWLNSSNLATYYNGTQATATSTITGDVVSSIAVNNPGGGYDFHKVPTVSLSGGGGTGATATAIMNNAVTDLILLNGGNGYSTAPTVTLTNGATAICRISGGAVASCTLTAEGGNYITPPTVTFTGGGGTGASATAVIEGGRVVRIDMVSGGSGYSTAPTVTISSSTTDATATATIENGKVTGLTITNGGSFYTSCPRVIFSGGGTSAGGAEAIAYLSGTVSTINVTNGGSGYTSSPTVTIPHPTNNDVTHPKETGHQMLAIRICSQLAGLTD